MQMSNAFLGALLELLQRSEQDRFGRTRFCACRRQPGLLTVVAERTFEGAAVFFILLDHAERTGNDAIGAAVADVRLHVHAAEFRADDGSSRTSFQASGNLAVLANVARELPRDLLAR